MLFRSRMSDHHSGLVAAHQPDGRSFCDDFWSRLRPSPPDRIRCCGGVAGAEFAVLVNMNTNTVKSEIHAKVGEIAKNLGKDAKRLRTDELIPLTGLLDSAGLMELMMWFEATYDLEIDQADFTMDNFGSIDSMTAYLKRAREQKP